MQPPQQESHPTSMGLGDYTERLLANIGVTEERWMEAKRLFGPAEDCNCQARKEWLNRVGAYFNIGKKEN